MKETFRPEPTEILPQPVTETFQRLEAARDYTPLYQSARVPKVFDPAEYQVFFDPTQNELELQAEPPHYRTITFDDVLIPITKQDIRGQYTNEVRFAVNVKGVGWLRPSMEGDRTRFHTQERLVKDDSYDRKNLGFMSKDEALFAAANSEKLMRHNVDTEVIWYMATLQTIPFRGEKVPIRTLIENNVIANNEYVLMTRLLKTNSRVGEVRQRPEVLEKALTTYKKHMQYNLGRTLEHAQPQDLHHEYLEYLISTLGKNSANLLNGGLAHNQIHGRNITLAGEVVDTNAVSLIELSSWLTQGYDDFRQMMVTAYEFYKEYAELGLTKETPQTVLRWYANAFVANISRTTRHTFEKMHGRDLGALTYDFARSVASQNHPPTRRVMQSWKDMTDYLGS